MGSLEDYYTNVQSLHPVLLALLRIILFKNFYNLSILGIAYDLAMIILSAKLATVMPSLECSVYIKELPDQEKMLFFIIFIHSNIDIVNKSIRPFLFTILNNSLYQMHVICLVNHQNGSWV